MSKFLLPVMLLFVYGSSLALPPYRGVVPGTNCNKILDDDSKNQFHQLADGAKTHVVAIEETRHRGYQAEVFYTCGDYWAQMITYGPFSLDEAIIEANALSEDLSYTYGRANHFKELLNEKRLADMLAQDRAATTQFVNNWWWELGEFRATVSVINSPSISSGSKSMAVLFNIDSRDQFLRDNPDTREQVRKNFESFMKKLKQRNSP